MKKTAIAVTVSAIMVGIGVSSSWAQLGLLPIEASAVKGQGLYQHFFLPDAPWGGEWFPSDEEVGQFEIRVTPDPKGKKAPEAVVNVNGPELRKFWGGPLHIRGGYVGVWGVMWDPSDPKPGQFVVFQVTHPSLGEVAVSVYVHDNQVPGYNDEDPQWSDWFGVVIDYDGDPVSGDEIFTAMGIVTNGNIVDDRN